MSARLSSSFLLIKPPEINSQMKAELFYLELVADVKPFLLFLTPSVSETNIENGF